MGKCLSKRNQYTEDIQSFIRQNPQRRLSLKKLYTILKLYEKWRARTCDSRHFERYVLHYITERAFWSDIEDGEYVAELLVFLYLFDERFAIILLPEESFFFPPLMNLNEDHNSLAQFFLNHAYRKKLTIAGRRIAELEVFCKSGWCKPCLQAVNAKSPSLLQLLLQYGALESPEDVLANQDPSSYLFGEYYEYITILTCYILRKIIIDHQHPEIYQEELHVMVQCAKLVMKVSPHFEKIVISSTLSEMEFMGDFIIEEAISCVIENYVPELRFRIYVPMTLKHACRLKVRLSLHRNWRLPHGIDELQIPVSLKSYINLCCD